MLVFVLILILGTNGWCAVINVPADYPTVQQGLNAAAEHDTVLVADGAYYENLKFPPLNLTLASHFILDGDSAHIVATILDGRQPADPDSASVILIAGGQDSSSCVEGFTITGGKGTRNSLWWPEYDIHYGGGCALYASSPIIRFNHFTLDSSNIGSGVYLGPGTDARIQDNQISYNHCIGGHGAISGDSCSAAIVENEIHHNSANNAAGLCFLNCQDVTIVDNYIHHNTAVLLVAGYFIQGNFTFIGNTISDHTISEPLASPGVGLSFGSATVTILDNQFLRNTNGFVYGALRIFNGSSGVISGNFFQNNTSISKAAALDLWDGTYDVSYNQFIDNHDDQYGVVYFGRQASVNFHHNTITGSTGLTSRASAILANINFSCQIHDNNIFGNSFPAVGLDTLIMLTLDATDNWWGDPSGPYHPILNPQGLGDAVGRNVLFDPWLTSFLAVQDDPQANPPSEFRLNPVHPNPFNASTVLSYELPAASFVKLDVFDMRGRLVSGSGTTPTTALVNGWRQAGTHEVTFDGSALPSGIYIYRIEAGEWRDSGKMVLLK